MKERENLKKLLKKVIHETENNKFHSAEELVQTLIREITSQGESLPNVAGFDK
ncbi:hypothetical protein ACFFIS_03865 [Virgibacillus soli]|uniref:Uncharacterized protein n=1 Tax=Paracerasibacillus soli TaxID=480284 RepID=A0ABU5CRH2_9BACI|nr:hypothetical protein [Virgibacillus soli]MDY0408931.1 hypothetical protein [Virgibacillus soli]